MTNKRYWLRGGAIMTLIFIIVSLLFFSFNHKIGNFLDWAVIFPLVPFAFGALFVGGAKNIFIGFSLQYLLYLFGGFLLGWLYARNKNKTR